MSNNKVSDEVIEKIRKCLALAHGRGATQGEMEAAMGKAKEIAMRYHLEIADISMEDKSGKNKKGSITTDKNSVNIRSKHVRPYHRYVTATLMEVFGIRVIQSYRSFIFIGETFDVAVSCALFPWLEEAFWSCYWQIRKSYGETEYVAGTANGAYLGFYNGLLAANKRAEATLTSTEKQSWALVVVDKNALVEQRMKEEFPNLGKARKSTTRSIDHGAYAAGYAKGKTVNLRQVSGGTSTGSIAG